MLNKKRTLMILLAILLLAVVVLSACDSGYVKPGQEFAADDLVDKLIEEGAPSMPPTATPAPTPTKDLRVGFNLTDDAVERIMDLWPAQNITTEEVGTLYAVYGDNDPANENAYLTFEFQSEDTVDELKGEFGNIFFGMTPTETYASGEWEGETNELGDPLEVTFNIVQMPVYSSIYVSFPQRAQIEIVDGLHAEYWPQTLPLPESFTDDELQYRGFGYFPMSSGFELARMWRTPPGEGEAINDWFTDTFGDVPGFNDEPREQYEGGPLAPRTTFPFDIYGDGEHEVIFNGWPYNESDRYQLSLSLRVEIN